MKTPFFTLLRRIVPCTLVLLTVGIASAQQPLDLMAIVQSDTSVRTGTLPGGSTYYIKHNAKPEGRANFYIYYKVGAVQEEDNQDGLAHFLEHMAFNGSKHFSGTSMRDYLSSVGIRFGENLNAWTSQDATSYMITDVPLTRESIVDSVLLVLHDWAGFLSLDPAEIDNERGVIKEEFRTTNSAAFRIMKKQAPVMFAGTIYAQRDVLGTLQILDTFKYEELKQFYQKWYRPDLQTFVIVGDFDPDQMEQRLREVMSDVTEFAVKTPKKPIVFADTHRPLISIESDPELTTTRIELLFRYPTLPEEYNNRYAAYRKSCLESLATAMFNSRMAEITQKEGAPFLGAYLGYGNFIRPVDFLMGGATAREGEALRAFEALGAELMKMKKGGFRQSELDRAKTNFLRAAERTYENRNDRRNGEFQGAYIANFEDGSSYPDPETRLKVVKAVLANITLGDVNVVASSWVQDKNSVILISMPAKDSVPMPTSEAVMAIWDKVSRMQIEAYTDGVTATELMDASGLIGSKVAKTEGGAFESTVLTLKNGVRVVVKPTKFKADEIQMSAVQAGGSSQLADVTDLYNMSALQAYQGFAGVGEFSRTDLRKVTTGKIAGASPQIGSLSQGFGGSCSPKDLETMLQLVYLHYTAPRFDRSDWNVMMNQYRSQLPSIVTNPVYILSDSLRKTLYADNPRSFQFMSEKVLDAVSLERVEELYRQFMSNAYGMTFTFVGNVELETLVPLVEKYLGSLPAKKQTAAYGPYQVLPVEGAVTNTFRTKLETPKVTAVQYYTGPAEATVQESVTLAAIRYILEMRYTQLIREEKGGTYGVGVGMSVTRLPEPRFLLQMSFNTDESKIDELLPILKEQIDQIVAEGVTEEELIKAKEFFIKKYRDDLTQNGRWMGYLTDYYWEGVDNCTGYEEIVSGLNSDAVRAVAERVFKPGNICTVVQYPLATTPATPETPAE